MKKYGRFYALAVLFALGSVGVTFGGMPQDISQPDIVGFGQSNASRVSSTPVVMIDYDGDILPAKNAQQDLGESTRSWKTGYFNSLRVSSGIMNTSDFFIDLSSGQLEGLLVGGFSFSTGTLIGSTATAVQAVQINQTTGAFRNLTIFVASAATSVGPGTISTTTIAGTATFYGYNNLGFFVSEVIRFSTTTVGLSWSSNTVTNSSDVVRYIGIGNVAWAYVSSFTITVDSITQAFGLMTAFPFIKIGFGQKIGLTNNIVNTADVYKITEEGGLDTTNSTNNPAVVIDTTYDTIVFQTLPNGINEKKVWYKTLRNW